MVILFSARLGISAMPSDGMPPPSLTMVLPHEDTDVADNTNADGSTDDDGDDVDDDDDVVVTAVNERKRTWRKRRHTHNENYVSDDQNNGKNE